ncbi:MAG: TetR/AcrR family transcriptional regulator [Nannocystaceae bacterium]
MPSATFFNLPPAKRERITELAIEEFSERPYHRASLSRLVARAGIAKGSVYQYFDDKLDLYRWLLTDEVPRRKLAAMQAEAAADPPSDLRGFLRQAVLSGLRFMLANPRLSQMASAVTMPTDDPHLRALYAEVREGGHEAFVHMLRGMAEAGQLRADLDLHLVARVIASVLGIGLRDIVLGQLGVDMLELLRDPAVSRRIDDAALETVVDGVVQILVEGLERSE